MTLSRVFLELRFFTQLWSQLTSFNSFFFLLRSLLSLLPVLLLQEFPLFNIELVLFGSHRAKHFPTKLLPIWSEGERLYFIRTVLCSDKVSL